MAVTLSIAPSDRVELEAALRLDFRSDSLLSLTSPAPPDVLAALQRSPVAFPPLSSELWSPESPARPVPRRN